MVPGAGRRTRTAVTGLEDQGLASRPYPRCLPRPGRSALLATGAALIGRDARPKPQRDSSLTASCGRMGRGAGRALRSSHWLPDFRFYPRPPPHLGPTLYSGPAGNSPQQVERRTEMRLVAVVAPSPDESRPAKHKDHGH